MPTAASPVLKASLEERLRALRGGADVPAELLDLRVERMNVDGEIVVVVRPADWPALRAAQQRAGGETPYWAVPWPSGLALARALAAEPPRRGARVLELGCGLAIPSVVAARAGAAVTATDGSPDGAIFAAHVLALNEVEAEVVPGDWRAAGEALAAAPWDLVLAADVLYTRQNVESLLRLLPRLLGPRGEAWVADPGRAGAAEFLPTAKRLWRVDSRCEARDDRVTIHRLRPRAGR